MNSKTDVAKNAAYNTFGTFFYFFFQWLITVLVVKLSGYEDAGTLSLIISTTNIFYMISLFGVRNYQVSDIDNKYSENQYIYARIFTTFVSLILFIVVLCFLGFDKNTLICSIVYIFYKFGESFTDVIFGLYQKYNQYKCIAISYVLKGIIVTVAFVITLKLTNSLFLTLLSNVVVYYLIILFYDYPKLHGLFAIRLKIFNCKKLLLSCLPLMVYTLIVPYLNFLTRYMVEKEFGRTVLGYYSSISMIFVVLSTLMGSIFVTIIPSIAKQYLNHDYAGIKKTILMIMVGLLAFGVLICIIAYFIGTPVFVLVFSREIKEYMYLLIPTIIASLALTSSSFFSTILMAFQMNKAVLGLNAISVIICSITILPFISLFGLSGSLYCLTIGLLASSILLYAYIYHVLK